VDKTGKEVAPCQYASIGDSGRLAEGMRIARTYTGKMGALDSTGREIIPCIYDEIASFSEEGLARVTRDGKYGYIDLTGAEIVPCQYTDARDFSEGLAAARKTDGTWVILKASTTPVPTPEPAPTPSPAPTPGTAYASTQSVLVDGKAVEFQAYALKDANGYDTNYVKLRDVAYVLSGTAGQFQVGWDGAVNILAGQAYTANGSEMTTPFSGNRSYETATAETRIDGKTADLEAILLKDDAGAGYTYYKLRDLGTALGFKVDWSAEKGIFIETK